MAGHLSEDLKSYRLALLIMRRGTMETFKIDYLDGRSETVDAKCYQDIGAKWIEFLDNLGVQLLRVHADTVVRVEVIKPT